jgi:hypothetical protein
MGVDQQPIPGRKMNRLVGIEKRDFGLALDDEDPFVVGLVKPKAVWRDLTCGHDALDTE